jgi:hypothetical protein
MDSTLPTVAGLLQGGRRLRRLRPAVERNAEPPFPADREDRAPADDLLQRRRRASGPDLVHGLIRFIDVLDEPIPPAEADAADLVGEAERLDGFILNGLRDGFAGKGAHRHRGGTGHAKRLPVGPADFRSVARDEDLGMLGNTKRLVDADLPARVDREAGVPGERIRDEPPVPETEVEGDPIAVVRERRVAFERRDARPLANGDAVALEHAPDVPRPPSESPTPNRPLATR